MPNFVSGIMRRLIYILALAALLAVISCRPGRGPAWEALDRAEALTPVNPDSALALLQAIDPATLRPGEETARHALLLTQAGYKCLQDETDDSLIRIAADWYDKTPDTRNRMLSNLYLGFININLQNYQVALRSLLTAEKLAVQLCDTFNLGVIYRNLCRTYGEANIGSQELHYAKKAIDCFKATGKTPFINEARLEFGNALCNNDSLIEALKSAESLMATAKSERDTSLLSAAYRLAAYSCLKSGRYDKSLAYFDSVGTLDGLDGFEHDSYNYMLANIMVSNLAPVDSIITRNDSRRIPYVYWIKKNNYVKAFESLRDYAEEEETILVKLIQQQLTFTAEEFYRKEADIASARSERHLRMLMTSLAIAFVVMTSIIVYAYQRRKNQRLTEDNLVMIIDKITKESLNREIILHAKDNELNDNTNKLQSALNELKSKSNELDAKTYEIIHKDIEISTL